MRSNRLTSSIKTTDLFVGAAPSLRRDDEIGLVRIGLDHPRPLQHRPHQPFAPRDADQDARRPFGTPNGWIVVEPALEAPQAPRSRPPTNSPARICCRPHASRRRARSSRRIRADAAPANVGPCVPDRRPQRRRRPAGRGAAAAAARPADAGQDRQHGNDEQHVPDAVVDGRTLNDEKSERQRDRGTDDKSPRSRARASAAARRPARRSSRHLAAISRPSDRSGDDRITKATASSNRNAPGSRASSWSGM